MSIVTCKCGARKVKGDPCAGCGKGLGRQTLVIRRKRPISLTTAHGFHSAILVPSQVARALVRF